MFWVLQSGPIVGWQKHCVTGEVTRQELSYEIHREFTVIGEKSRVWIVFQLRGGPTGYESFVIDDGQGKPRYGPEYPHEYWSACAGTKNRWHELRIHRDDDSRAQPVFP